MRDKYWATVLDTRAPAAHLSPVSASSAWCDRRDAQMPAMHIPNGAYLAPASGPARLAADSGAANLEEPRGGGSGSKSGRGSRSKTGVARRQEEGKHAPFKCSHCSKSYGQKGDRQRHIRCAHLNERNFPCKTCGNRFGRRSILNKHMQRHRPREDSVAARAAARAASATALPLVIAAPTTSNDAARALVDLYTTSLGKGP